MDSLAIKKSGYEERLARIAGWGESEEVWGANAKKAAIIRDCVESGLRRFYHCGFDWEFLKPTLTRTLDSGASTIRLPDDFGGFEGTIGISDSSSGVFSPLKGLTNPGVVQQMHYGSPSATGKPEAISLRHLKMENSQSGQTKELYVFPTADQEYTIKFRYFILPNFLNGDQPYAYGGAEHSETILEGCLAILEERYNDMPNGPHAMAYARMLAASQQMDRRRKHTVFGRNVDRSDDNILGVNYLDTSDFSITDINGSVVYEND